MDTVKKQLTKMRWAIGINGALSVALGIVIIVWPSISLYSLVIVFGAFALARGIVGLVSAIAGQGMPGRGWLVVSSLASIGIGVLVFFNTQMSALALLYVIGAYAIVLGVITIGGAFWLPLASRRQPLARSDGARLDPLRRRHVRQARGRRARGARPDRGLRPDRRDHRAGRRDRRRASRVEPNAALHA